MIAKEQKVYSRYIFNRGLQTLWKGDTAVAGSQFRSVAITSDEFNSTQGTFQVFALEGVGRGIRDGKFAGSEADPKMFKDSTQQERSLMIWLQTRRDKDSPQSHSWTSSNSRQGKEAESRACSTRPGMRINPLFCRTGASKLCGNDSWREVNDYWRHGSSGLDVPEPIGFMKFAPVVAARGPMFGAAIRSHQASVGEPVLSESELYER